MTARVTTVLIGCLVLLGAVGCGGGGSSSTSASDAVTSSFPAPPADPNSPEGVAVEALRRTYSWQPATEQPGAAMGRARSLLGPHLLRVLDTPGLKGDAGGPPKADARWAQWAADGARVDAAAFASGEPAPGGTPDRQQLKVGIEQTVIYPDGRTETLPSAAIVATVVHTAQGWRLDDFG